MQVRYHFVDKKTTITTRDNQTNKNKKIKKQKNKTKQNKTKQKTSKIKKNKKTKKRKKERKKTSLKYSQCALYNLVTLLLNGRQLFSCLPKVFL